MTTFGSMRGTTHRTVAILIGFVALLISKLILIYIEYIAFLVTEGYVSKQLFGTISPPGPLDSSCHLVLVGE